VHRRFPKNGRRRKGRRRKIKERKKEIKILSCFLYISSTLSITVFLVVFTYINNGVKNKGVKLREKETTRTNLGSVALFRTKI